MRIFFVITVLLTFLQFSPNNSFSVQKRNSQSPSDLQNALAVLRRKRRRIQSPDLESLYRSINDRYLPYDDYLPYQYNEDVGDRDSLEDQYALANMLDSYQKSLVDNNEVTNKDKSNEKETPTIDEIKEIFNEIDKNGNKKNSKSEKESSKMSQEQMDELLSEAVKVPKDGENTIKTENNVDSPQPVSTAELQDVFKDKKEEENNEEKEKGNVAGKETVDTNQESNFSNEKKRMTKRDNSQKEAEESDETLLNLVQEVQRLRGKVAELQLAEYLEDKENDYLASALKDATLAQIRKQRPYLEDEYSEIQKALEIEESLQALKIAEQNQDGALEEDDDERVMEEKRSDEPYADNLGVWYDEPVREEDDAQQRLENFVKQYRATYDVDNEDGINNNEPMTENIPIRVVPENEDICSQIDMLSSNCEVASSLDIDDEARDLCNRHELCYTCGATVGISQQDCDGGFRSETVERCRDGKCIQSGAEFLWFIKQDHKYVDSYLGQCDDLCVKQYIVGDN